MLKKVIKRLLSEKTFLFHLKANWKTKNCHFILFGCYFSLTYKVLVCLGLGTLLYLQGFDLGWCSLDFNTNTVI